MRDTQFDSVKQWPEKYVKAVARGAIIDCPRPVVVRVGFGVGTRQDGQLLCGWDPKSPGDTPPNMDNAQPDWQF